MHPLLENLSVFTWMDILQSNEICISLLGDLGLIPERVDDAPACPKCSSSMKVRNCKNYILRWQWICKKRKNKENPCFGVKNPLNGTFFENNRLPIVDIFALMFGYFLNISVIQMQDHINCWRRSRKQKQISKSSVTDFYSRFKEIILNALRKKGEFSENLEKTDVKKLFQKYTKTKEVEPLFRNLVFQLLMDIKSEYPCFGDKVVREDVDIPASTSSSSDNVSIHIKSENDTNLSVSTNVSSASTSAAPINESTSTSVSTADRVSHARSVNTDIQNSNYNAVTIENNSIAFLGKGKILNNSIDATVSAATPSNTRTTLGNALISGNNTVTIQNTQPSIDNTAAKGFPQTSKNNLSTVNLPLSVSTDFMYDNLRGLSVFFTEENMDIETDIVITTTE